MACLAQFAGVGVQLEDTEAQRRMAGVGGGQRSVPSRTEAGALYLQKTTRTRCTKGLCFHWLRVSPRTNPLRIDGYPLGLHGAFTPSPKNRCLDQAHFTGGTQCFRQERFVPATKCFSPHCSYLLLWGLPAQPVPRLNF